MDQKAVLHRIPSQDARIVRTAQALRAALLALLERKPLEQITVRDITAEAGISYATFFRHHATKEALLDHVAAEQLDRMVQLALPVFDSVDAHASLITLCRHIEEHRAVWVALLTGGAAGTVREELLGISQRVAVGRARVSPWLPVELGVICATSLLIEIITWWLRQEPGAYSIEQMADILERIALAPTMAGGPDPG